MLRLLYVIPQVAPSFDNCGSQIGKQISEIQCLTLVRPPKPLPPDEEMQFR